ncbi:MAG TPA: STAS domain-containing protein [Verrucomicrobiae bacterium]|nr:STAS domain-containing protein [Verrucomicrobiae bacterium]
MSDDRFQVAAFTGEIDFTGRDAFRGELAPLADVEVPIVDLSAVTYMDSSAMAEILYLQRGRTRKGRAAMWIVVSPPVRRLFEVAGLQNVFPLVKTVDEAKAQL